MFLGNPEIIPHHPLEGGKLVFRVHRVGEGVISSDYEAGIAGPAYINNANKDTIMTIFIH